MSGAVALVAQLAVSVDAVGRRHYFVDVRAANLVRLTQLLRLSPGARNRPHQVHQVPLLLLKEGWPARLHPEC